MRLKEHHYNFERLISWEWFNTDNRIFFYKNLRFHTRTKRDNSLFTVTIHYKSKHGPKIQLKNKNKSYFKSWLKFTSFISSSLSSMGEISLSSSSSWNLLLLSMLIPPKSNSSSLDSPNKLDQTFSC